MIENETIKHQLNHRAIRAFKDQTLSEEQLTTLYEVARHTATSMFMQQFSILHITDDGRLHTMDIFFQALQDTMLAVQNVINAAESMGLGIVPLGTVNDDPKAMLKVLDLPELTYPALGLQVGVPDQEPQLKPRLPLEFTTFENEYPRDFEVSELKDYDEIVQTYYDLRDANRRIDSFTNQINGKKLNTHQNKRDDIVEAIHSQGLALDFN